MFCHNCGKRFNHDGDFCVGCGVERLEKESNGLASTENAKAPSRLQNKKPEPVGSDSHNADEAKNTFSEWWERALPLGQQLEGFVNAEQGQLWISDQPIFSCGTCDSDFSHKFTRVDCASCGKTKRNSVAVPIGSGDGTYPVFHFFPSDPGLSTILAIWAADANENYSSPIPEYLRAGLEGDAEVCDSFERRAKEDLATFLMDDEYELTSFGSVQITAADARVGKFDLPGLAKILVSGPRDSKYLDCAEVRIGTVPGEYEVLGVTRAGEVDRLSPSAQADEWIQQPKVLAVLAVKKDEIKGIFPHTKVIHDCVKIGFFSLVERWVSASRMSRGDLPAVWANWEILNDAEDKGDLASVFQALTQEGYLHQIWTWVTTNPPTLLPQLESQSQFGKRFAELKEWSAEPADGLSRKNLSDWFK